MRFLATPGWGPLSVVVGVSSPILAEDPGCGSSPLLSGVRWWWWCVVPRQTWLRVLLVAVPRHSWLGPAGRGGGGGPFPWVWIGGFPCCECLWRGACAWAGAFVCLVSLWCLCWWWCGWCGGGVSSACVGVRACVCVVCRWSVVACPRPLSAGACCWCLCWCGWCVLWVVPRNSWLRVLGAVPRHCWLGSAVCGGGLSLATPD